MNHPSGISNISLVCAFLVGVLLFLSFGKNWLALDSILVFLAGLMGVALIVLVFGVLNIRRNSHNDENDRNR